jgi:hypothetical protein
MTVYASANANDTVPEIVRQVCARDTTECLISNAGVVIGKPGYIDGFENSIASAAKKFEHYFGAKAPQTAVIMGTVISTEERETISEQYSVVMPWLTSKDRADTIKNKIRESIKAQQPNLEGAALEAVVEQAHKSASAQSQSLGQSDEINQGALAHELGHLFFIRTFWPGDNLDVSDVNSDEVDRYGGPAPDWLDEMAAVLMENEQLTETRNSILTRRTEGVNELALWDFDSYFQMTHPVFEQAKDIIRARQKSADGRAQGGVVVLTAADIPKREDDRNPVMFYAQSRGFANYMIEKTGNERIFAEIASHIAGGGAMESWLKSAKGQYGIAANIGDLEADFRNWLVGKYGPGGSTEEA